MALGLGLRAIEALLIPRVGVAGVLGVAALFWGVALSVTGEELAGGALARIGWMLLGVVAILSGADPAYPRPAREPAAATCWRRCRSASTPR